MPIVPTYSSNQASVQPLAPARVDTSVAASAGTIVAGRQMENLGNGVQRLGDAGARIALDMQAMQNQARLDEALNSAKEAALQLQHDKTIGFTNLRGRDALERPDGKPLADEYSDKLNERVQQIAAGLGNDAQRSAFGMAANNLVTSFRGAALAHESNESKTYMLSVAEGIQATAIDDIGKNWNNPAAVDGAIGRIRTETYRQAQLLGKSAEWQEASVRRMASNGHKVALLAALENGNPMYAEAYLKKHSDQMDANDILAVRGHITKEMDTRVALGAASDVVRSLQPRIVTSEGERAFNIAVNTESGGRQFGADGKPLTSKAGAIGIAQVMPGTAPEAAKLAGLEWDENRYRTDPNYNKAIGFAYFQKQLQDNGGDLAKAYAAYNAGPGALQKAVKDAERSAKLAAGDPNVPVRSWLEFMPKETRDYVAKNLKAYESGNGQNSRATFQDIDDALRARPELANSPTRYKLARDEAQRQFDEQTKAIKQRDEEAVAVAMRGVVENGGRFSELPVSVRAAVPAKEIDNVIGFAQKIAKGDDTTSLWLYNKLTNDRGYLGSLSDNQFYALRRELSEADFKHFSAERAKLSGAVAGSNGPGDLNSSAIKQALDERLRMFRMDPTPKDGSSDAAHIGAMRKFVNDYFVTAQREAGKKFSDAEVVQHVDALFARNTTMRGFFSNSSGPMLGMKTGDIPSTDRDALKAAFKRRGVDAPTDAQILNAYWTLKIAKR